MEPKLIRDNMPVIAERCNDPMIYNKAEGVELINYLGKKLIEEATEAAKELATLNQEYSEDKLVEEIADILEVIDGIKYHVNLRTDYIELIKNKKYQDRGGFFSGFIWSGNRANKA